MLFPIIFNTDIMYRKKKIKPADAVVIKPPTLSERIREIDETIQDDVQACLRIGKLLEQAVTAYPSISLSQIQQLRKLQAECQLVAYAPLDAKGIRERLVSQALELAAGIES